MRKKQNVERRLKIAETFKSYKSRIREKDKAFGTIRTGKEAVGGAFSGKTCFGKV